MATIFVDDRPYQVQAGQNLLQACLAVGLEIPYFCWHPAMGSVGACRQCAIKLYKNPADTRGKIVFACMTSVEDQLRISIADPEARAFRRAVADWLMTNHPHDCPVCDEGGECHLQDMIVMSTHTYRSYRFSKRTFRNQQLGSFLHHEMNRCIQCFRCVRFYRDLAGGRDLAALGSRNRTYFGRYKDGDLESPYAGNLVEVCPTGVFTDAGANPHPTRKWDLQTTPSICPHCSLGCNTLLGERYATIRRVLNRYHPEINGHFLCDRGRFGHGYIHSDKRIQNSSMQDPEKNITQPVSMDEALSLFKKHCHHRSRLVGVGSPRASLESNYALRNLVGADRFSNGMNTLESDLMKTYLTLLRANAVRAPSLQEVSEADAIFVLGDNLDQSAPMLAFAIRQAGRNPAKQKARQADIPEWDDACIRLLEQSEKSNLIIASSAPTWLDPIASVRYRAAPVDVARLGFAVAHALDPQAPSVQGLPPDTRILAQHLADTLQHCRRPIIAASTSCASSAIIQAAVNLASSLSNNDRKTNLCLTSTCANSLGTAVLSDLDLSSIFELFESGRADTLVVLENDLHRQLGPADAHRLISKAAKVVLVDHLIHPTALDAHLLLASANPAESSGTFINYESRAQRFFEARHPNNEVLPAWRWIGNLLQDLGDENATRFSNLESIHKTMLEELPNMQPVLQAAWPASYRIKGKKVARQSHRYSGRTAIQAHQNVSEIQPPEDSESPLCFSMEGYQKTPPKELNPRYWKPGWNSVQALFVRPYSKSDIPANQSTSVHLIPPQETRKTKYFSPPSESFIPLQPKYLAVSKHHVFGSEELSAYATLVSERTPLKSLGMNPNDAKNLGLLPGRSVEIHAQNLTIRLTVYLEKELPPGIVIIPAGSLPSDQPTWIELTTSVQPEDLSL